jgi:hypothetical protein
LHVLHAWKPVISSDTRYLGATAAVSAMMESTLKAKIDQVALKRQNLILFIHVIPSVLVDTESKLGLVLRITVVIAHTEVNLTLVEASKHDQSKGSVTDFIRNREVLHCPALLLVRNFSKGETHRMLGKVAQLLQIFVIETERRLSQDMVK